MPRKKEDEACLWDMFKTCLEIEQTVANKLWNDFERDNVMRRAIERLIEILGEAARHVSTDFQNQHPDIPWNGIIKQRHVIAHDYAEIEYERIWKIAVNRVPELLKQLTPIIQKLEKDG